MSGSEWKSLGDILEKELTPEALKDRPRIKKRALTGWTGFLEAESATA